MTETFGFKKVYGLDLGTSIVTYQKHEKQYRASYCYNNAFYCLMNNILTFRNNKVVIGYVLSTNGKRKVAVRHAWNIINNIVVDVTMIANSNTDSELISSIQYTYLPISEYTPSEFADEVEKNNNLPCLKKTKNEYYYISKLKKKGFEILD